MIKSSCSDCFNPLSSRDDRDCGANGDCRLNYEKSKCEPHKPCNGKTPCLRLVNRSGPLLPNAFSLINPYFYEI